ncbi:hypothetical protein M2323_000332 [Rhodoblastus acidophilus]|uniref:hypothetical protein n=1 Tax=Rhodoblastus acidophilus TaxID=1074 RepID=UPI002224E822|nr:hypothetical protein [Rhodoblastus acidophilus]MCW2282571.1 hypothetical protein [Rhodoblastus acidophilus]MCW2331432.1 hypothetical protein [Rhodoblastus acidophilus]
MSVSKKISSRDELRQLEDALIESVIAAPTDEFREDLKEAGEDFDAYVALADKMIIEAEAMCAKARFADAKAAAAAFRKGASGAAAIPFDRDRAKAKLKVMNERASENPMMLAARKGKGLSSRDEDALLAALADLEKLEAEDGTE